MLPNAIKMINDQNKKEKFVINRQTLSIDFQMIKLKVMVRDLAEWKKLKLRCLLKRTLKRNESICSTELINSLKI